MKAHRGTVGFLILAAFASVGFWRGEQIDDKVCSYSEANREIMREILRDANKRTQTSKQRTPEEKKDANKYYKETLKKIPPVQC